jgi:hypothetical protein
VSDDPVIAPSFSAEGLATFRRAYRWLNLTLIQTGLWPLLVVTVAAPVTPVALTPLPWYWVRLAAPILAALLALAYVAQRPNGLEREIAAQPGDKAGERRQRLREQAAFLIIGVTVAVAIWRLIEGPLIPVAKLAAFGLADAAAFQAINFGVVGRDLDGGLMRVLPVVTFGLSWGLRDLFVTTAAAGGNVALAFASGITIGLIVGAVSFGLRRWPGGGVTATAFQFLGVSLVLGFVSPL